MLLQVQDLVAEIPALAHLPGGIDAALRTKLSQPVRLRYCSAITRLFTFIWAHWPGSPLLPVAVPMLLLFLQSVFNTAQSTSPVDTTVRAVNWIHRIYGHPEVIDATINNTRSGWAKMVSSRIRHTAMITTAQIAAMMAYAIEQNIEQNKHPSVVSIQLVFLRGSFSHFYRNVQKPANSTRVISHHCTNARCAVVCRAFIGTISKTNWNRHCHC